MLSCYICNKPFDLFDIKYDTAPLSFKDNGYIYLFNSTKPICCEKCNQNIIIPIRKALAKYILTD